MSSPAKGRVEVAVEDDLSTEDRAVLVDGLVGYNRAQGYVWERRPLNVVARDGEGGSGSGTTPAAPGSARA